MHILHAGPAVQVGLYAIQIIETLLLVRGEIQGILNPLEGKGKHTSCLPFSLVSKFEQMCYNK